MPYFPILQKPTQNNLITKTSFRQDAPSPWRKNRRREDCPIGAIHRHRRKTAEERLHPSSRCIIAKAKNRRRAVSYVSTGLARLPRDANTSPIYRRRAVVETSSLGLHSLVAERRHSSVTRYAKRSVACRDSPRQQPLRAGGTPLPHHRRLPSPIGLRIPIVRHHHHLIAPTARCEKPPKSGLIC